MHINVAREQCPKYIQIWRENVHLEQNDMFISCKIFSDFAEHAQFRKICPVSAYPNNSPENVISDTLMNM